MKDGEIYTVRFAMEDHEPQTVKVICGKGGRFSIEIDGELIFRLIRINWWYRLPFIGYWIWRWERAKENGHDT